MGTRALITINQKPFIATHWDGYPSSLGADLLPCKTEVEIIAIAEKHTIDFAAIRVCKKCQQKRFKEIAAKTNGKYSIDDIAKLHKEGKCLTFGVMGAADYPISNIRQYGDWAEYQYDFTNGKWYYRPLSGSYPSSLNCAGKLKRLTKAAVKESA